MIFKRKKIKMKQLRSAYKAQKTRENAEKKRQLLKELL